MSTRNSSEELTTTLTAHITELAKATDAACVSEAMIAYLEMTARFHKYSTQNLWLILMACPTATHVAGYKRWRSMGRYVRKGEYGIPILAPVIVKVDEEEMVEKGRSGTRFVTSVGHQSAKNPYHDSEPMTFAQGSLSLYPCPDSNWDNELRRFAFYPLEPQGR